MSPGLLDFTEFDTKNAPQARKVTKSAGAPRFFKGAPVRLNQAAIFDLEIAAGGRRSLAKGGEYFCDFGGAGFFLALNHYSFSVFNCVFASQARAGPGLGPG